MAPNSKTTLASKWSIEPLKAGINFGKLFASMVTTLPDVCPYGQNTPDPVTAMVTSRQSFISELIDVMASDEWTQQDMKDFVSGLSKDGAQYLGQERYIGSCTTQSVETVSTKWHEAMTSLGFRNSAISDASARHQASLLERC